MEGKKRVVPGEICAERSERSNCHRKVALSAQKSAEAIVPEKGRAEPTQAGVTGERRMAWREPTKGRTIKIAEAGSLCTR